MIYISSAQNTRKSRFIPEKLYTQSHWHGKFKCIFQLHQNTLKKKNIKSQKSSSSHWISVYRISLYLYHLQEGRFSSSQFLVSLCTQPLLMLGIHYSRINDLLIHGYVSNRTHTHTHTHTLHEHILTMYVPEKGQIEIVIHPEISARVLWSYERAYRFLSDHPQSDQQGSKASYWVTD